MNKTDLHNYQKRAINFALNRPYCALYIDMGLGKTIVTLTLIKRLLEVLETGKTFITAPKRVCYKTWPDEVKKWDHVNDLDYQVIKALSQKHKKGGREKTRWDADIHIVNREIVPWWVNVWEKEKWPYDTVVMDESSSFKQYNGKRFKALKSVRHRMDRVIQLTGTPTSTSLLDLWAQIYMLDCGARLGPTYSYFKQRYFMPIDYEQRHWVPKPGAKDKIYEILSDICLTMRTEDYLDLPGSIDNIIKVDLPSSLHDK
ncbi:DEAD/DEAH box helicase family protein, partial [Candidatus Pacearchaeota archaeon]|nr:DEAD/DEAH box helicase family protein [Candidatus Pacearchaeota archaeon]